MKTLEILNSSIPTGGRMLTSAECRALRSEGYSCNTTWKVTPDGADWIGSLWFPTAWKTFSNAGIRLQLRQGK